MNFALFRKYRYEGKSEDLEEIYSQVLSTWLALKATGCNELFFYVSDTEPKVFFGMSLWLNLEQLEHFCATKPPLLGYNTVELLEEQIFELIQDYRMVSEKPEASFIRVVLYPEPVNIEKFIEANSQATIETLGVPGFIAGWTGRALTNHSLILGRVDWSSREAMAAFLKGQSGPQLAKWYLTGGTQIEYASYDLHSAFPFKPVL
jgi:hypothetical protein